MNFLALINRIPPIACLCAVLVPDATSVAHSNSAAHNATASALPVLIFQAAGSTVQDRTRVPGLFTVVTPNAGPTVTFSPSGDGGNAELSVRGNSSYHFSKKSYRLELQDEDHKDRKAPLLGMPADSDWVLYASVTDRTFARNLLAQELWRRTGRYAVRWRFAEVFVITNTSSTSASPEELARELPHVMGALTTTNPSAAALAFTRAQNHLASSLADSYAGVYVVMEKIKRGKHRASIAKLRPEHVAEPEITGGYIIKKDDKRTKDRGLLTGQEFKVRYEEPKESELTPDQRQWMTRYLDDFEKALFGFGLRDLVAFLLTLVLPGSTC